MRPWKRRIHCNPKSKSTALSFDGCNVITDGVHVTGGNKVDVAREDIRLSEVKPLQKVNPNKRRKRLCDSIAVKQHFGMAGHPICYKNPLSFVDRVSLRCPLATNVTLRDIANPLECLTNLVYLTTHSADDPASVIQFMEMAEGQLSHLTMLVRTIVGIGETYSD